MKSELFDFLMTYVFLIPAGLLSSYLFKIDLDHTYIHIAIGYLIAVHVRQKRKHEKS